MKQEFKKNGRKLNVKEYLRVGVETAYTFQERIKNTQEIYILYINYFIKEVNLNIRLFGK